MLLLLLWLHHGMLLLLLWLVAVVDFRKGEGGSLFFVHFCHRAAAVEAAIGEFLLVSRFQNLETAHQGLVHRHHGTSIVKLATVVWSREECDQLALCKELITILNYLVSSAYQVKVVFVKELGHHLCPKCE